MEYGLGPSGEGRRTKNEMLVLILVLMEYGLGPQSASHATDAQNPVLILVLMEYGLGRCTIQAQDS